MRTVKIVKRASFSEVNSYLNCVTVLAFDRLIAHNVGGVASACLRW